MKAKIQLAREALARLIEQPLLSMAAYQAAIIAFENAVAELQSLLLNSKRAHSHCDDSWYCCGKCQHPDHALAQGEWLASHETPQRRAGICDCGAEAWNTTVEHVLVGTPEHLVPSDRPEDYKELRESLIAQARQDKDAAAFAWHHTHPVEQWAVFLSALEEIARLRALVLKS